MDKDLDQQAVDRNRRSWDDVAEAGDELYVGAAPIEVARARKGEFRIIVTPTISVPMNWFGDLAGKFVLALACGGGQQAPLLAAAGANVTCFDLSKKQLARDQMIAEREDLEIKTVQGDMRDLGALADESFDLVLNPTSVCFCPTVLPVWKEAARVLRTGGFFITGFNHPLYYIFDQFEMDQDNLVVRNKIPYSDFDLSEEDRERLLGEERSIEFSHTLNHLIGGQIEAGLSITDFYTDHWGDSDRLSEMIDMFIATRAIKNATGT